MPGVLIDGAVVPQLSAADSQGHITNGAISGGMVPKVRSALDALRDVAAVRITDLAGLRTGSGTRFVR